MDLSNGTWQALYDTQYVPSAGDLDLIVDKFALLSNLDANLTWSYELVTHPDNRLLIFDGPPNKTTINAGIVLNDDFTYRINTDSQSIISMNVSSYNSSTMPFVSWPNFFYVNASSKHTWKDAISVDDNGWLSTTTPDHQIAGSTGLHIAYGLGTPLKNSSSVQIGLVFMAVVILCNLLKVVSILFTLKSTSAE